MREASVKRGDVLAGKYRVESVLGVGGMGVVVAAMHLELLEPRAIKLMLPEALENADSTERFLREARAASRLASEHVARVHDVGRLDDGAPYMVMEYLAGTDLRSLLKERGRIPAAEAVLYALQACEALAEAHALGIVHRDLKPGNLFLTTRRDGSPCVKVLDFGISKIQTADDPEMTATQAVLGSPTYMSPEQMRSARSVDARSDIWSLGVILHRLVTGQPPFQAENLTELVALVLSTTPTPASALVQELPAGFDDVLLRCMQRDPGRRWANVAELATALLPFAPEEAQASAPRIARVLAGGARSLPPSIHPPPNTGRHEPSRVAALPVSGPAPRYTVGTHSPWASTPLGGESISMRRRTFVALAATAAGLALAGVVALVFSARLARRDVSIQDAPDAAHTLAAPALPSTPSRSRVSIAPPTTTTTPTPTDEPSSSSASASRGAERPAVAWSAPRPHTARPTSPTILYVPPPPPTTPPPAPNRIFGTDP